MSNMIASRILDGIFIGNYIALQEQQYLNLNKITHVVNCAASEIQAPSNLKVLNYYWKDEDYNIIITISNVSEIATFVQRAIKKGESVLFCCLSGQSRSLSALIAYLMYRYQWSLLKVIQYINIQKKEFEIRASFMKQLIDFEKQDMNSMVISRNWNQILVDQERVILQNTYLNSVQKADEDQCLMKIKPKSSNQVRKKVSWARCLIQYVSKVAYFLSPQSELKVKSILKKENSNISEDKKSFSKANPRISNYRYRNQDDKLFVRRNNYSQSNKKQSLNIQTQKVGNFVDIEFNSHLMYTQQVQRKYRSLTNTPRQSRKLKNFDRLNNSTSLVVNDEETIRKSPLLNRKAQFKLV